MDRPLTNRFDQPGHTPRQGAMRRSTRTAQPRRREVAIGRVGWRPQVPSVGPRNRVSGPLAPTIPLAWRHQSESRWPGAHKSARVGTRIRVSGRLAPTNRLRWGRESAFRAGWYPKIPSGGDANPRFAPVGAHKSPRVVSRIRVSRRWHPQIPSGGVANSGFAPVGAHKSPRVGTRIRVSRRLAPTNRLRWGRESGFRAGWRPQIPSGGVANPRIAPLAPTNPLGWGRESEFPADWYPKNHSGGDANPRFAPVGAHKSPRVGMRIRVSRRLAPTDAANRRARGPGR